LSVKFFISFVIDLSPWFWLKFAVMGKTLYRYIIIEQLVPLSICFFGLIFVLVTGRLMQFMQYLFASNLTILDFLQLIALAMPKLSLYALPMAALVGVLLAFLRLTADNEVIVMRASGIQFFQFLWPVLSVLLVTSLISLVTAVLLLPASNALFKMKLKSLGRATVPILLKERTFIDVIPKMVFFFQDVDSSKLTLQGIFVEDQREAGIEVAIVAERGQVIYEQAQDLLLFRIYDGVITRVKDDFKNAQTVSFKEYELPLRLDEILQTAEAKSRHRTELTMNELQEVISQGGRNPEDRNRHVMEYHLRLALPLACLLLGLLAAPLGSCFRQANRMAGVTLGLSLFLGYYVLLTGCRGLGENGVIPAALAVWIPNSLTLILGSYLWIKMQRETPLGPAWLVKFRLPRVDRLFHLARSIFPSKSG
jgi:lipopolysaccharide export system permease protein